VKEKNPESSMLVPRDIVRVAVSLAKRTMLRWPIIAVAFCLGIVLALIAPKILRPVYSSETLILYEDVIQTDNLLGAQQYATESRRQMGMRLREMLLSRTNLERIIVDHNLLPSVVAGKGMIDAVDEFRAKIDCRVRENETFRIVYQGEDPDEVYEVTKALSDSLVAQNLQYRKEKAEATKKFLEAEQTRMIQDLSNKEQNLAEFLVNHPEFAQDAATSASAAGASVRAAARSGTAGDSTVAAIERQLARLRAQQSAPAGAKPTSPTVITITDPKAQAELDAAEAQLTTANSKMKSAQAQYTENHPVYKSATAELQTATDRANRARSAARAATTTVDQGTPSSTGTGSKTNVTAEITRLEGELAKARKGQSTASDSGSEAGQGLVDLETKWGALQREISETREQHEQIGTRLFRATLVATVEESGQASRLVVVDEAYKPRRPTRRGANRTRAMVAAVVTALGITVAFGIGILDDRVFEERDLRKLELGPILHVVSRPQKPRKGKK